MSKKDKIVEMLNKSVPIEDICTELEVSTSYVYRIKREMDESEGDRNETSETEDNSTDGMVIDSTGRGGNNVERNNEGVEKKEGKGETNKDNGMGGIKKKKKTKKKVEKIEKNTESTKESGGIIQWLKKKWKMLLMTLTVLMLFMMMFLLPSRKKPTQEKVMNTMQSRFPQVKG